MTLAINDTRSIQKGILWDSLKVGHVYIDCYGNYVMAIDFGNKITVVDLSDGLVADYGEYVGDEVFTKVKAKLEIFG